MIAKLLRKLGLGHAAYRLAAPFYSAKYGKERGAGDVQAAMELLESTSPKPDSSCYIPGRPEKKGGEDCKLDIIIPAYNVEEYIRRCVDSVLSQKTSFSFRVLVVDDGSTDSTGKILDGYKDICLIRQENKGFSGARNTGLEQATAEYIMFLDADDELCPGAVESLMEAAEKYGAAIVEGAYTEVDSQGNIIRRHGHKKGTMSAVDCEGYVWGKLIKRELFNNLVFTYGFWYQDSVIRQVILPLADKLGLIAAGIENSVVLYRQNPKGITKTSRSRNKSLDSLYITMQLFEDRKKYGLELSPDYYDYILSMAVQTYSRTRQQSDEVKRAIFTVYADFLDKNFRGWETKNRKLACLEKALREGDYGKYLAYCQLH